MAKQPTLFDLPPSKPMFGGRTYDEAKDEMRLAGQLGRVKACLNDGEWWTLRQLSEAAEAPEASVSSRLRDLRKEEFGGHTVDSQRREGCNGLWEYKLIVK